MVSLMDPTHLIIIAVLCSVGSSYVLRSNSDDVNQRIWAEWTAWGAIALGSRLVSYLDTARATIQDDIEARPTRWKCPNIEISATILALLLVASRCIEIHTPVLQLQWSLPLVTIFTFILTRSGSQVLSDNGLRNDEALKTMDKLWPTTISSRPEASTSTVLFIATGLASAFVLGSQAITFSQTHVLICVSYMVIMVAVYLLISWINPPNDDDDTTERYGMLREIFQASSIRAFVLYTFYLASQGTALPSSTWIVLVLGMARIFQVLAIVSLSHANAGVAASTLATISVATTNIIYTKDTSDAMSLVCVCLAAILHLYNSLPKSELNKLWILVLLLVPIIVKFDTRFDYTNSSTLTNPGLRSHPMRTLAIEGQIRFEKMVMHQSTTVEQGAAEYKRRYGRPPPPGYDRWFEIARSKDFQLIDEFDTIMQSLEPFWGISPSALRERLQSIKQAPDLVELTLTNGTVGASGDHYHVDYLSSWLNTTTWGNIIPDISFMISTLDEPRVVAPYDTVGVTMQRTDAQRGHNDQSQPKSSLHWTSGSNKVKWISVGKQDAWEAMLSSCPVNSPARGDFVAGNIVKAPEVLPFVSNVTTNKDVCASPDLLHGHGFFASPESLTITHSLVPVFAQCKPSIFNDVLYPSPYYQMQIDSNDYNENTDTPFSQKLDRVYWAGTATGGYASEKNWMTMHRQRLTMLTSSDSTSPVALMQHNKHTGMWEIMQRTWASVSELFHFKITAVIQCSDEACKAMEQQFKPGEKEPKEAALESKYAIDIDGNTFSGRYYRLLKSNVCVLKHTSFNEWHDGRLIPWVHFIPVSAGAEELGEMARYLTQEEEGRVLGEKIANQGRDWARKTLRKEDMEVVFVRILMEYARIVSDARLTMNYEAGRV